MSTLNVGNITDGTNSVDTEKLSKGTAAAWVNFNGTGTVTIRDSYNVSSITDNGTGYYTKLYPMENTTYATHCMGFSCGGRTTTIQRRTPKLIRLPTSTTIGVRSCYDSTISRTRP